MERNGENKLYLNERRRNVKKYGLLLLLFLLITIMYIKENHTPS